MAETDRRVERTKGLLRKSLIALLTEHAYEDITVQDIVDGANVGRSTFYSHYADKEDLLVDNLSALGEFVSKAGGGPLGFARPLFEHVQEVRPMFESLLGHSGPTVVQETFLEMVRDVLRRAGRSDSVRREAKVHFVAAGFLAIARFWVVDAPELSVDEVHAEFMRLARPAMGLKS